MMESCSVTPVTILSIPSSASASLWPQPVSSGIHQGPQTCSEMGKTSRNPNFQLLGRFTDNRKDVSGNQTVNTEGMPKNASAWMAPQFEKVITNTFSADLSPRLPHRHLQNDDFPPREEDSQPPSHGLHINEADDDFMDDSGSVYWDCSSNAVGQPASTVSYTTSPCSTEPNTLPTEHSSHATDETRINLVDQSTQQMERSTYTTPDTDNANIHGRIGQRLRDCVERQAISGQMDNSRAVISHQLQRIASHTTNISPHSDTSAQSPSTLYGQYISDRLYQEVRRDEITQVEQPSDENLETLFSQLHTAFHSLCTFQNEPSGCTLTSDASANRMDITKTNLSIPRPPMGTSPLRSVCFTTAPPTTSVCDMELSPSSRMDQRFQPSLAPNSGRPTLSDTSLEPVADDPPETTATSNVGDNNHAELADSPVVPLVQHPESAEMESTGLEHPRKHRALASSAISLPENAIAIISNKTFSITSKQYVYRQQAYQRWCETREWNYREPSAYNLVNYLADNYTFRKWKLSTVQSYANSIILMFSTPDQDTIRKSQVYQEFFQGLRHSSIQPTRSWDYNVIPITDYLLSLGPNSDLSPALLTTKTAWLLAVVGFLRPSDIERIDLDNTSILSGNILQLRILAPKKKRRGTRISKTINIHPHNNPLLCPVSAFVCYRERLASVPCKVNHPVFPHVQITALFRSLKDTTVAIGAERISKHINTVMQYVGRPSGAPLPKARALGATLAAQAGVAVDDIVVHGNWSSKALFEQFYRISVLTNSNFTLTTLDAQQRS
ncbi:hypothetical protein G6F43_008611 [Rhizopus delemar]|nr:hypothetical protein G6F43_008611 [Rhizopus delemar]